MVQQKDDTYRHREQFNNIIQQQFIHFQQNHIPVQQHSKTKCQRSPLKLAYSQ